MPIDVSGVEKRFSLSNNLILVELLCYLISVESVVAFNLAWCSVLVFVPIALGKRWLAKVLVLARLRSGCYAFFVIGCFHCPVCSVGMLLVVLELNG